jgi:hypothetical protein
MTTIDHLLLEILNNSTTPVEQMIAPKDARVLRSLASSISSHLFITENQSRLLMKILRENTAKLRNFSEEIDKALTAPLWSKPFRHIEQVKKFYIEKNSDHEYSLAIEFTFSSEIRRILSGLSQKIDNFVTHANGKLWTADLTEQNIVTLVEALEPLGFEIDVTIKNHYETIKSWSEPIVKNQFLITNMENKNFHQTITNDLGIETTIDQNIINDRSMRYQYFVENAKNPGENLVEYIANRSSTKIWIDKNQYSLVDVMSALIKLRRLPLLVVFDTLVNSKYLENLEFLSNSMKNLGIDSSVGIYFRLPNDEIGKKFNSIIADNQYNQKLDKDLKVAAVSSGKIPKFFIKNAWKPMSVIALDTRMGLRHGKTSVYTNCCDLIIEYAEERSILEDKKIAWR